MKNIESMPNPAQQPEQQRPKITDEDVEGLLKGIEEHDVAKAREAAEKKAAKERETQEALNELSITLEQVRQRQEDEKAIEQAVEGLKIPETPMTELQAAKAKKLKSILTLQDIKPKEKARREVITSAFETVDARLEQALETVKTKPKVAAGLLISPVEQHLRTVMDPEGNFGNMMDDERLRKLYDNMAAEIHEKAVQALKVILNRELDEAQEPERISGLHKVLEAVESYGS